MNESAIESSIERVLRDRCKGEVRFDQTSRGLYATDASIYQMMPKGVVTPVTTEDAQEAIRVLGEHRIPMLPRGGGTSLAGQCVNDAVVVDLSRHCNRLIDVSAALRACRVEPGITVDDLNDRIRSSGMFFAPDPSTARQATIAGCIGNNAAGAHSILYGRTSESVTGIDACLWDGTRVTFDEGAAVRDERVRMITDAVCDVVMSHESLIRERFPKTMRRSSGYQLDEILAQLDRFGRDYSRLNLAPLLCGSEGTLAFTLGAALRLHPVPRYKGLAVMSFETVAHAIAAVQPILSLNPSAVELLDQLILDLARKNSSCRPFTELLPEAPGGGMPNAVLYVEFLSAESPGIIDDSLQKLRDHYPQNRIDIYTDPESMKNAWTLRKSGEPLLHAIAGSRKPLGFVEDNAIPVENLAEFVAGFRAIVEREGTVASYYAHASVGVLHVRPLLDLRDPSDEAAMIRIARDVAHLARSFGGVPSGEHGDGRARGPLLPEYFGEELMEAFRAVKSIFDPYALLNPGNIVDPAPLESIARNTRIHPCESPIEPTEPDTYFEYQSQGGFGHAVEMCNGAGVCRNKSVGTMCPSYHATLDEHHSTRGRGNTLRLAISGQLGEDRWSLKGTRDVLDLCLSCKACKSECPSNVDIAKLKAEYLAQGYATTGHVPLSARVFSRIHTLNRLGSLMPTVTNAVNRFPPFRSVINQFLGVHPARSLPRFASPVRVQQFSPGNAPRVLVLADTFANHNEPEIVHATLRVLGRFGYATGVLPVSDLGRSAISQGCLPHAIRDAERTIDRLGSYLEDPTIVGFVIPEPSCLSAVCDDWQELKIDRAIEIRSGLAKRCATPESFLDAFWGRHPNRANLKEPAGKIYVHGHCHQKALWGEHSAGAIFQRLFPDRTVHMDTGCCGMAGGFGYMAAKYDLSMKIGSQRLFPQVHSMGADDVLIASGTSCRHQILDGTGCRAMHAIEYLAKLLD
ncbi:MAG: FAD-binding protein [Phycisphaerales bacterium]|nr:FAD-binding protein [Phycisphaerales bacterium]